MITLSVPACVLAITGLNTMSRHLLAKLTAKGLYLSTGAGGGEVYITSSDVAAALGMGRGSGHHLSNKAYVLGLVKYCDDPGKAYQLRQIILNDLNTDSEQLVDVVIQEGVWRPIHMTKKCQGRGCSACGDGVMKRSVRERALIAGLPTSTFYRAWQRKVDHLLMKMDAWDNECLSHLYKQFNDRDAA